MRKIRVLVRAWERPFKIVAYKQSYKNLGARTVSIDLPTRASIFSFAALEGYVFSKIGIDICTLLNYLWFCHT